MSAFVERLDELGACYDALSWWRRLWIDSVRVAWLHCERVDWMLWLLYRLDPHRYASAFDALVDRIVDNNFLSFSAAERAEVCAGLVLLRAGGDPNLLVEEGEDEYSLTDSEAFLLALCRRYRAGYAGPASTVFDVVLTRTPLVEQGMVVALREVVSADEMDALWCAQT